MFHTPRLLIFVFLLSLQAGVVEAQTYVPDELRPWQQWVLKDREYRACPFFFNRAVDQASAFVCAWPGEIAVDVSAGGARFRQSWTVYAKEQWVGLPGDASYWPDRVTVNDRPVAVVMHDNTPSIKLAPGNWRVSGRFEWDERPGVLRIPQQTGLVALTVDGKTVGRPELDRSGVFLGERQQDARAANAIRTVVHRLVVDDIPTRLVTRLQVDVSGSVREELFGPLLPEGFTPVSINSPLPAKLEADGVLHLQVRPGQWTITLHARGPGVADRIRRPSADGNMADSEIWSFQSNDELRVTAVEGLPPVDPSQVDVPAEWRELPAFRLQADAEFNVTERSRGVVMASNELGLDRTLWLDFDGGGFVVRDRISGVMKTGWRLDMSAPYALLSATEYDQNLLITRGSGDGETGIEIRQSDVDVNAIGRIDTRDRVAVSGWMNRFADVRATINLPPGHKLIMAPGVDSAPGSWTSQWHLLDFFLVLIITVAVWRLFGIVPGAVALLAMTLSFHEANAPAWLWLNVLVAIALMRVAPKGKLRQIVFGYQALSAIALLVALVPFVAGQLRMALYPQLEPQRIARSTIGLPDADDAAPMLQMQAEPQTPESGRRLKLQPTAPASQAFEEVVVAATKAAPQRFARYAPNAIVQAGPGIPSWRWNSYALIWSGPVDPDQTMRLVVMPRWMVSLFRIGAVALSLLFAAILAADLFKRKIPLPAGPGGRSGAMANLLAIGLFCGAVAASPDAAADIPDADVLQQLEQRLLEAPDCVPRCAEIVSADIVIRPDTISMDLSVHAVENVAIPLPGSQQGWRPRVTLSDGPGVRVFRAPDGSLWLNVAPGRHTVALRGAVPAVDSLEVPFMTPPRVVTVDSEAWFVAGIKDRRLTSGSLQLTRLQTSDTESDSVRWESSRFPVFARVERSVELDLDWRVTTTVHRIAPARGALTLEIPLLAGETIVSGEFTVQDGRVTVTMNPQQRSVSWRSNLPLSSPLVLDATEAASWQEVWSFAVGNTWNADFEGVPQSNTRSEANGVRTAVFHPRAGESLTMSAARPTASEGSTLAFDAVQMTVTDGSRSRDVSLALDYRSTRGSQHVISIPAASELTSVRIDNREQTVRPADGQLTLPILPGSHKIALEWREASDAGFLAHSPVVDLGAPASNIDLKFVKSQDRWLLATGGPSLGPAVLYWSELAVLIVFALILGRTNLAPLAWQHWLLLGLGFSTFNWTVLAIVVVWLLLCGARDKMQDELGWWQFNVVQVVIAAATVAALVSVVAALPAGLLGTPDMHVAGHNSYGNVLSWFADKSASVLPVASIVTVPMWTYKVLILLWALWLSFALLRWLPWVWRCFSKDGYWRSRKTIAA